MTNHYDRVPTGFTTDHLAEPKPATITHFQSVCNRLDEISDVLGSWRDEQAEGPSEHDVSYCIRETFVNGTKIDGHSTHGSDEWLRLYAETMPTRGIRLCTSDGVEYDYSEETNRTRLWVKNPGERVAREVLPKAKIDIEVGYGTSLHMEGTPEIMQTMGAALAERREVRRLGLDIPTDGSMKEFTAAIQAALESGVQSTDTPPESLPTTE